MAVDICIIYTAGVMFSIQFYIKHIYTIIYCPFSNHKCNYLEYKINNKRIESGMWGWLGWGGAVGGKLRQLYLSNNKKREKKGKKSFSNLINSNINTVILKLFYVYF